MYFSTVVALPLLAALCASAANITVKVGDGGLMFNPPSVTAQNGDTIAFQFVAKNHSVTQSTFDAPCTKRATPEGIDSGFQSVESGATSFPEWSFTIDNATAPLWFFCAQTLPIDHCASGMVFAVNAPADKSFDAFRAAARATNATASSGGLPGSASATDSTQLNIPGVSTSLPATPTSADPQSATTTSGAPEQTTSNAAMPIQRGAGSLIAVGLAMGLFL